MEPLKNPWPRTILAPMDGADSPVQFAPLIEAVIALFCLGAAYRAGKRGPLIDNLPTSKATGVFIGLVELKGTAETSAPLTNLLDTEQRIALARGYFNDIATHFNTRLETVPEKFVARLVAMQPQALLQADEFERAAVKVDFAPAAPVPLPA